MGVVKEGLRLVEKDPQPLGVILHLEVEKGINIVRILFFAAVVKTKKKNRSRS